MSDFKSPFNQTAEEAAKHNWPSPQDSYACVACSSCGNGYFGPKRSFVCHACYQLHTEPVPEFQDLPFIPAPEGPYVYQPTTELPKIENFQLPKIENFQLRVKPWLLACFGEEIASDKVERNHRFLEEALELVQSIGCTAEEAHQLVDYVFGREVGETNQEIGGVMVTLAALCLANGESMSEAGEKELARIWTKVEAIRAKQKAKPQFSPLPE